MTMSRGVANLMKRERKEKNLPLNSFEMHERHRASIERVEGGEEIEIQERYIYRVDSESDSVVQVG